MNRVSFNDEQVLKVAKRHCSKDVQAYQLIASKRGSAALISTPLGKFIIKYADINNTETETNIVPSRSLGIKNEIEILSKLPLGMGPQIKAFSIGTSSVYAVLHFLPGSALNDSSKDPDTLLTLLRSLVRVVGQLHKQDVIHGDITPHNIVVYDESIQLIDFELSHYRDQPGIGTGLYHFLSPETATLLLHDQVPPYDIKEEIFALTATCLSVLTGNFPYSYSTLPISRLDALNEIAQKTHGYSINGCHKKNLPLANTLKNILESPPDQRPSTANELYEVIEEYL